MHVLTRSGASFTTQESAYTVGAAPRQIAVGDYNGDGRPDLAVTNWGSNTVSVLLRNSTGAAFVAEGAAVPVGVQPFGIRTGDFNRDGRPDIALVNEADDTAQLLLRNPGNDGFTASAPVAVPDQPKEVAVADFDSNGAPDVVVASIGAGAVTVLSGGAHVRSRRSH